MIQTRQARITDRNEIAEMCAYLWPNASAEEHSLEATRRYRQPAHSKSPANFLKTPLGKKRYSLATQGGTSGTNSAILGLIQ